MVTIRSCSTLAVFAVSRAVGNFCHGLLVLPQANNVAALETWKP